MISPFFGLSVIIHILVIVWHKLRSLLFPGTSKRHLIHKSFIASVFGAMSVFLVSTFVMFCAVTILYASFIEPHSDLVIARHVAPRIVQFDYESMYAEAISVFPQAHTIIRQISRRDLYVALLFVVGILCGLAILYSDSLKKIIDATHTQLPVLLRILALGVGVVVLLVGATSAMFHIAVLLHISLAQPPIFAELLVK